MEPFSNRPPNLFIKVQGNPKDCFNLTSSQVSKQVKSNEHIINQSGKKPMIERRPTKNMQERASATLCFTYTSSHNHCEKNQNTRKT
jgi:hypothetical protein